MARRWLAGALGVAVGLALVGAPAAAKPPPVTKISFKLDVHEVVAGTDLTGSAHVWTRSGNAWVPLPGATLSVKVDGTEVSTLTADTNGYAEIVYAATGPGDHVMKVVFAGDDEHKRARRAQGFSVTGTAPVPEPDSDPNATVPEAPFLEAVGGTGVVSLTWTTPADGGSPIIGYKVHRGDQGSGSQTLLNSLGLQNTYDDTTVVAGVSYWYVVTAVNAVGESAWSNEFMVTPG